MTRISTIFLSTRKMRGHSCPRTVTTLTASAARMQNLELPSRSMDIKTAFSSSAPGIQQAWYSIRSGEYSAAIVAGYNLNLAPGLWVGMSAQMTLSPDGSSKTFDASADGYARGDGVTALYVKRL